MTLLTIGIRGVRTLRRCRAARIGSLAGGRGAELDPGDLRGAAEGPIALTAADGVLIPMQCEYYAMEGLAQLINTVRSVKQSFNKNLYVEGLLLTMFDKRNRLSHQVAEEIHNHFGDQVFTTRIPRNVRLSESPSHGKTIMEYDIKSTGAQAYSALALEFLKRQV